MFLTPIVSLPSPSTFIASTSEWASPMFDSFYGIAVFAIGIFLGIFVVGWIIHAVVGALHSAK